MGEKTKALRLRQSSLTWRTVADEMVLLDIDKSSYLSANASAAVLWDALVSGTDREQLVAILVETYGVDDEQAARDADAFIDQLDHLGLLES